MKGFIFFVLLFGVVTEGWGQRYAPTPGQSDLCNYSFNVNCYNQYSKLKKSVIYTGSGCTNCSGVVLNNTSQNGKLYFLTSSHCVILGQLLERREVYWGYEQNCLSPQSSNYLAYTPAGNIKLIGIDRELDFAFFEINASPSNYTPYYAGWDFSGKTSNINDPIVIHHPKGDFKKIAFANFLNQSAAPEPQFVKNDCMDINYVYTPNSMWRYQFTENKGLIESGSSGSPIFDDKQRIIGITTYHEPASNDCIDSKILGTKYQLIYPLIKSYLDPEKSGVLKIDGYDPSNPCSDTYEDNNSIAKVKDESLFPDFRFDDFNGFLKSKISSLSDVDYYSLTFKNSGGFKLSLKDVTDKLKIELFDESSTEPLAKSRIIDGIETLEYVYTGTAEKKVYAKISVASGVTSLSSCSRYKLAVNYKLCYDPYENNNVEKVNAVFEKNTKTTPLKQELYAKISSEIDQDLYFVETEGKGKLIIKLGNLFTNYQIAFLTAEGIKTLGSSAATTGSDKIIIHDFEIDESTHSYIRVYDENNLSNKCSNYHLSLDWQPDETCEDIAILGNATPTSTSTANDGSINLTISTGQSPFTVKWSNGATSQDISGLDNGLYTVTITGKDGCKATKTFEVKIAGGEAAFCSNTALLTAPKGYFDDKSGSADYANNSNCRWKIMPPNAQSIILKFSEFKLHASDKVRVYNGTSNTAPLLAEYSGEIIPPPSVTAPSGAMYVQFISDGSNTSDGFSASYTAVVDDGINQITSYNLWFDNQFDEKRNFDIHPSNTVNINLNIPTDGLAVGLHSINFRFNDQYDQPSPVTTDLFVKTPPVTEGGSAGIVGYEYWFDNLFDNRLSSGFDPIETFNFNEALEVNDLAYGLHSFNMRFIDNANNWSPTTTDLFVKEKASASGTAQIVGYEYWFDNQFSNKVSQTVTATTTYTLLSNLDVTGLAYGLHSFNSRFKDNTGQWSPTTTDLFVKERTSTTGTSRIIQFQYWFDDNFQDKVIQAVTPTDTYILMSSLNTSPLLDGDHTISFRFLDNADNWSPITKDTFEINHTTFPVELTQFKGNCTEGKVSLQWQTATEQNSAYFDVLYSASPQTGWKSIANIAAKGNSTVVNDYSTAAQSLSRLSYYRLRQVDKDGSAHYSATIAVECKSKEHYLKVYPNPAHDMFMLESDITEGALNVEVLNYLGQTILKKTFDGVVLYPLEISLDGIKQSGAYMVKVSRSNGEMVGLKRLVVH